MRVLRRDHLRVLAQSVEVDAKEVRIMGTNGILLRTLVAVSSAKTAGFGVPSFVPKWRARRDSNYRFHLQSSEEGPFWVTSVGSGRVRQPSGVPRTAAISLQRRELAVGAIYHSEVPPRVIRRGKNVSSLDGMRSFPAFSSRRLQGGKKGSHLTEFPQSTVTIDACC